MKVWRNVPFAMVVVVAGVMAYGAYHFPRAPFQSLDGQYIDKGGFVHSREEYEHLKDWEKVFIASWGVAAVFIAVDEYLKPVRVDQAEARQTRRPTRCSCASS